MLRVVVTLMMILLLQTYLTQCNNLMFEEIVSPFDDPSGCGRQSVVRAGGKSSAICDFDFLLPDKEKDIIEGIINSLHVESNGQYGGAIAIIKKYDPRYLSITNTEGYIEEYTEAFANHVFEKWRLKSSDFLIFLVVEDRQIYVTCGNEMQKVLTIQHLQSIIRNVAPLLKDKNYSDALKNMILQFKMIIAPDNENLDIFPSSTITDNTANNVNIIDDGNNFNNKVDAANNIIDTNDNAANSNSNSNTAKIIAADNNIDINITGNKETSSKRNIKPKASSAHSSSDKVKISEDDGSVIAFKSKYVIGAAFLGYGLYETYKFVKYKWDIYINTDIPPINENYGDDDWDFDETIFNSSFPFNCNYCNKDFGNFSSYKNFQISNRAMRALGGKDPNKPMLMNCGHMFCLGCVALMIEGNEKSCPICYTSFNDNFNSDHSRRYIKFADDIETISFNTNSRKLPSYIHRSDIEHSSIQKTGDEIHDENNVPEPTSIIHNQIRANKANEIIKTNSITSALKVSGSIGSLMRPSTFSANNSSSNKNTEKSSSGTGSSW